jgi:hypothetical protein
VTSDEAAAPAQGGTVSGLGPLPFDTSRAHQARMYDYLLGGKDHFAVDREVADRALASVPAGRTAARENRAFLGRAVRYLAAEEGIRQFLDIGTGLPAADNVHELAQRAAPESRVAYVDSDPLVLAHARALLTGRAEGRIAYVRADLRDPAAILGNPGTREVIDFTQPVALLLVAVLHSVQDADSPGEIVAALVDALPPGSFLVASHLSGEHNRGGWAAVQRDCHAAGIPVRWRDSGDFARLAFAGLEMVAPGVVPVSEWRPDPGRPRPGPAEVSVYGGLACKRE